MEKSKDFGLRTKDFELALANFSNLLKETFQANDLESFKTIYNDYENLEHVYDLKYGFYEHFKNISSTPPIPENDKVIFPIPADSKFESLWLWGCVREAIYAWIVYSYATKIVSYTQDEIVQYLKIIERSASADNTTSLSDFDIVLNLFFYLQFYGSEILDFDRWEWNSRERLNLRGYFIPGVYDWIPYGLIVCLMRQPFLPDHEALLHVKTYQYEPLYQKFTMLLQQFKNQINDWDKILGTPNSSILDEKKEKIETLFDLLRREYIVELNKAVVREPLDKNMVTEFIEKELKIWQTQSEFREYFNYFNAVVRMDRPFDDSSLTTINKTIFCEGAKRQFTKNFHIDIVGFSVMWPLVRKEDLDFFSLITEQAPQVETKYGQRIQVLDGMIDDIQNAGYHPTVIIISRMLYSSNNLFGDGDGVTLLEEIQDNDPISKCFTEIIGYYKNIPVCLLLSSLQSMSHTIMVADFHSAFRRIQYRDDSDREANLKIQIEEITFARAKQRLATKGSDFYEKVFGRLTEEEAILELQTGVDLTIEETYKFEILDNSAFRINSVVFDFS
ncbi:MAG: hypothetical protein Q8919_05725 [Bacteroidota bacterium]|nr:hypothetical protein [Bacteroidota bacterium]